MAAGPAAAQGRAVVPIHQRVLSDGVRRYSVPVTVDGEPVEAALDTGSGGLRLLMGPTDVPRRGPREVYAFSGGVRVEGAVADADLAIGGMGGSARVHQVSKVGCTSARPRCSAAQTPAGQFGFEGDGLRGEGFRGLLGLGLAGSARDNPLRGLGVRRWIVSLPRPQDRADGRLVLDPTDEEVAGFVFLPMVDRLAWRRDATHDAVPGCLDGADSGRRVCGPVLLDSGASGLAVVNASGGPADWVGGARLTLGDGQLGSVPIDPSIRPITTGRDQTLPTPIIFAGVAPYMAFDVLYDPENHRIGLKLRLGE